MIVTYDSLTGQSKKFASKLNLQIEDVNRYTPHPGDEVLLVTRSFRFGEIPDPTKHFLERYAKQVVAVCVSGNRNWGKGFGAAGDKIEKQYHIPLVLKFEASGFASDVETVKTWILNYQKEKGRIHNVNV